MLNTLLFICSFTVCSAKMSGAPVWQLPLYPNYLKSMDSKIADINNMSSTRYGGSITAALFLQQFVSNVRFFFFKLKYDYLFFSFLEHSLVSFRYGGTCF
jgi:hypothetical protein